LLRGLVLLRRDWPNGGGEHRRDGDDGQHGEQREPDADVSRQKKRSPIPAVVAPRASRMAGVRVIQDESAIPGTR